MGTSNFNLEETIESPGRKGNGVYCSRAALCFTALTVCVLIAATALMTFYIPQSLEAADGGGLATKLPQTGTKSPPPGTKTDPPPTRRPATTAVPPKPTDPEPTPALRRGRLPTTVLPRRYDLRLRPFLYEEDVADSRTGQRFTFDGWARISVESTVEGTDEITMHAKNMTVHGTPRVIDLAGPGRPDVFESFALVEEFAFIVLKLKAPMRPHELYDVYVEYSGILGDDEAGFYPSKYVDPATNMTKYIATTQMEGPYARRAYPCFDEPTFKASYDVQLEHRADMGALCNGMETRTVSLDSHWSRTYFKRVPAVPTYLMAFIVHDFANINITNDNGCLIRIWCQKDLISLAPYALNVSDKVQTYFDAYLDSEYPLAKQDHIAIQEFGAGAMENWGLITYQDIYLLYGMEDFGDNTFYSLIIAHELAHQWFGNLVTMEWWDDLWLNEGFATYFEHIGMDLVHPEFKTFETFYTDNVRYALVVDSLGVYPALRAPVYADDYDIDEQFNTITYSKGGSVLWMMEHFLSLEVFNQGIQNYVKERSYKNANADHLWQELTYADEKIGQHDVKEIMDTWTLQRGYPLVTLTRTGQDVIASQELFLQINRTVVDEHNFDKLGYKWWVPLTYVYKSGPSDQYDKPQRKWMDPSDDYTYFTLPDDAGSDDWYLANAKVTGFYRVNYGDDNWERLLAQADADPNAFSEENKVGLIQETLELALAEIIPMSIHDRFASALANSSTRARRAAITTSSFFARMEAGQGAIKRRASSAAQARVQQLVEPLYSESGWDSRFVPELTAMSGRPADSNKFDVTSLACRYDNRDCVTRATGMFREYMDNPALNTIPPNYRAVVYCTGIRFGGQEAWDFGMGMLGTSENNLERMNWVNALSCSNDQSDLRRYLQAALDSSTFSRGDVEVILRGAAENPAGYEVAWDIVRDNWERVSTMFRRKRRSLCNLFEGITSYFNTEDKLQELVDFAQGRDLRVLKYCYEAAIVSTEVNIRWMAANGR